MEVGQTHVIEPHQVEDRCMQIGDVTAILHRLEEEGLIKGSWSKEGGRRRKVYKLTGTGERHLSGETDRVQEIVSRLMLVLRRPGEAPA